MTIVTLCCMSYIQLSITSNPKQADAIAEGLEALNALSVTLTDAKDTPVFQVEPGETPLWPEVNVIALFEDNISPREVIAALKKHLDTRDPLNYRIEKIADQDWVRLTQQHFKPQCYAGKLWICPQWCDDPETGITVRIDPGLAFGTGTHPTTNLCLEWLAQHDVFDKTVIDYGCGSGILSLAALALGATRVVGVDHDEQAMIATQNNAALNTEIMDTTKLETYLPTDTPSETFDLCIANILCNPLLDLKKTIASHIKPDGMLVLSGILEHEIPKIMKAYEKKFSLLSTQTLDQWACLVFKKR